MIGFAFVSLLVAMVAAFALQLADKWGVLEWVQVHGDKFFSKMFGCYFCLSWWAGVVLSVIAAILAGEWLYLFVPFVSTPITHKML